MVEEAGLASNSNRPAPFAHLFVATDFSGDAAQAIARTGLLPLANHGKITVIHVLSDRIPKKHRLDAEKLSRHRLDQAAQDLKKAATAVHSHQVEVASELCHGQQPYVEIIRRARSLAADLIVLGRHGHRPVQDMFIGSTAERVIRSGDLPALVVSRKANRPYRRPVVALDLEDTCRAVVSLAMCVLGPEVTSGTLVHAYHVPFEGFITPMVSPQEMTDLRKAYRQSAASRLARLQAALSGLGVRWKTVNVLGDPRKAILAEAVRRRADLIVVGTHGRFGLAHALLGSVAEWVVQAAACDVLVARPARVSFELP